jgi:hypothetical protein
MPAAEADQSPATPGHGPPIASRIPEDPAFIVQPKRVSVEPSLSHPRQPVDAQLAEKRVDGLCQPLVLDIEFRQQSLDQLFSRRTGLDQIPDSSACVVELIDPVRAKANEHGRFAEGV